MIYFKHGDLFAEDVEALVNPVNTVGVMGAGLALAFKERFPENFPIYETACHRDQVKVGKVYPVCRGYYLPHPRPKWIVNFPTQQHWRDPSQFRWIEDGLTDLKSMILYYRVASVAIPALGCGKGGLRWGPVRALIERKLHDLKSVDIRVLMPLEAKV